MLIEWMIILLNILILENLVNNNTFLQQPVCVGTGSSLN